MKTLPENFNPGAVYRRWDNRNVLYAELPAGAGSFDWDKGFDLSEKVPFKIEEQDGSLSCVGQAWSAYAEALDYLETGIYTDLSSRFIYSRIFIPETGGSYIYKGASIMTESGVATENSVSSYDNGQPPSEGFMRKIDDRSEIIAEALKRKAKSHAYVDYGIDQFALAIQNQNGLVTGFIGSNEGASQSNGFIRPPLANEFTWSHAVYCVGAKLINGKKYIKFANSWGKDWGDNGFGWFGEDYFKAGKVFNAITMVDLPNDWNSPTPFKHHFARDLWYGEKSDEVRNLQIALRLDGVFPATVEETGYYGNVTQKAVLDFWSKYKLASFWEWLFLRGRRVGPKTRAKLNEIFNN